MNPLSKKQRAALVVINGQGRTNPGSAVLRLAIGNRVAPTLDSLIARGLIEKFPRTDVGSLQAFSYRLTEAGKTALA